MSDFPSIMTFSSLNKKCYCKISSLLSQEKNILKLNQNKLKRYGL